MISCVPSSLIHGTLPRQISCLLALLMLFLSPAYVAAKTLPTDSFTIVQRGDKYRINISYPSIGNPVADAELAIWARDQATTFINGVEAIPGSAALPYELHINYELVQGAADVRSVVFTINAFMGGAHPEPGLATFVYDLTNGRRLAYADLFLNQEGLLGMLSSFCRQALTEQLEGRTPRNMIESGTKAEMANFDLFALTGEGLRVYFPPYQAAPYNEGYLQVFIPLEKLHPFTPRLAFWGIAGSQ